MSTRIVVGTNANAFDVAVVFLQTPSFVCEMRRRTARTTITAINAKTKAILEAKWNGIGRQPE